MTPLMGLGKHTKQGKGTHMSKSTVVTMLALGSLILAGCQTSAEKEAAAGAARVGYAKLFNGKDLTG